MKMAMEEGRRNIYRRGGEKRVLEGVNGSHVFSRSSKGRRVRYY